MKVTILILREEKQKKIFQIAKLPPNPNIKITKRSDRVIIQTCNNHYNKIPRQSFETFLIPLLKGRGCVVDVDYKLKFEEEE